jgi:hypothetical protein
MLAIWLLKYSTSRVIAADERNFVSDRAGSARSTDW